MMFISVHVNGKQPGGSKGHLPLVASVTPYITTVIQEPRFTSLVLIAFNRLDRRQSKTLILWIKIKNR